MNYSDMQNSTDHVYRVDKFVVPMEVRDEFVEKVRATHSILKQQRGYLHDLILEKSAGNGNFNFVTFVEWESADVMQQAREAVIAMHKATEFDTRTFLQQNGIQADIANYLSID